MEGGAERLPASVLQLMPCTAWSAYVESVLVPGEVPKAGVVIGREVGVVTGEAVPPHIGHPHVKACVRE